MVVSVVVAVVDEVGVSVLEVTGALVTVGVLVTGGVLVSVGVLVSGGVLVTVGVAPSVGVVSDEVVSDEVVPGEVVASEAVAGVVSSGCAPAASSVVAGAGTGSSTGSCGCVATGRDAAVGRADGGTVPGSALPGTTVEVDGVVGSWAAVPGWAEAVPRCVVRPGATVTVEADIAELAPTSWAAGAGGSVTWGTSAATRTARKRAPASTSAAPTIHAPTGGRRRLGGETVNSGAACRDPGRTRPGSSPAACSAPACLPTGPPPVLRSVVRGNDGACPRIRL